MIYFAAMLHLAHQNLYRVNNSHHDNIDQLLHNIDLQYCVKNNSQIYEPDVYMGSVNWEWK